MSYGGSVELISGIRPKNNGSFPLVNAHDVYVDDNTRLDECLADLPGGITSDKIYIATYGVTTKEELDAAFEAGKVLFVLRPGIPSDFLYVFTGKIFYNYTNPSQSGEGYAFSRATSTGVERCLLDYEWRAEDISFVRPYEVYGKYTKPATGIPKADLAQDVQTSLNKADTALQQHQSLEAYRTAAAQAEIDAAQDTAIGAKYAKPAGGIPLSDLSAEVRDAIENASGCETDCEALAEEVSRLRGIVETLVGASTLDMFLLDAGMLG